MKTKFLRCLATASAGWVATTLLAASVASPADAGSGDISGPHGATVQRVPVYGGATSLFGNCADSEEIPVGTDCVETFLGFAKEVYAFTGDSAGPQAAPWHAWAETYRITRPTDAEAEFSELRTGYSEDVVAYVDTQHFTTATLTATIPMSDGTTHHFQGTWTPLSDRQQYGNDGPALDFPKHLVTDCFTLVGQAHQKFTIATMTGTLNGQPVQSYTWSRASIFNNRFLFITAPHGPNCP